MGSVLKKVYKLSMRTTILVFLALALIAFTIQEVDGQPGIMVARNGRVTEYLSRKKRRATCGRACGETCTEINGICICRGACPQQFQSESLAGPVWVQNSGKDVPLQLVAITTEG